MRKLWELVYMFASVFAIRNAKSKVKVKSLQATLFEVVSLNHSKVFNWLVTYNKFNPTKEKHSTRLDSFI